MPPLWRFAVAVYSETDVAEACLELQDTHRIDVPLLLFAAYLAYGGHRLSTEACLDAAEAVAGWHSDVVVPLRALRRRLKEDPPLAPGAATETFRESVKQVELAAERIELGSLEAWASGLEVRPSGDLEFLDHDLGTAFTVSAGYPPDDRARSALRVVAEGVRSAHEAGRLSPNPPSSA